MPKKKKNTHQPTTLDKAFAISSNYTLTNPAIAEERRKQMRITAKDLMRSLKIETPNASIPESPFKQQMRDKVFAKELMSDYCSAVRTIMLGYWDINKVVYRIEPETIHFLDERFQIEQLGTSFFALMEKTCGKPIFIETRGCKDLLGFFCCVTRLHNETFGPNPNDENKPKLVISMVRMNESKIFISRRGEISVREYFSDIGGTDRETERLALRLLTYIGFLLCMKDAEEATLVRMPGKSYPYYQVFPIPYEDSLPDFSTPGGWVASGLCNNFGYLNRHTMTREFQKILKGSSYTPERPLTFSDGYIDGAITDAIKTAVLQWETHKVVFQYDTVTERKLVGKYLEQLRFVRLPENLLAYMPYRTLLLTQSDQGLTALVIQHTIHINDEPSPRNALIIVLLNMIKPNAAITILPCDTDTSYSTASSPSTLDNMTCVICALYHILHTFKAKAEKNAAKAAALSTGAYILPSVSNPKAPSDGKAPPETNKKNSVGIRSGYCIADEEPEDVVLFDLTPRTVKRAAREEAHRRCGYKMVPHIRRRHPHHYWVGSGDDRHLEVRWLDSMRINAGDKETTATTVHKLV